MRHFSEKHIPTQNVMIDCLYWDNYWAGANQISWHALILLLSALLLGPCGMLSKQLCWHCSSPHHFHPQRHLCRPHQCCCHDHQCPRHPCCCDQPHHCRRRLQRLMAQAQETWTFLNRGEKRILVRMASMSKQNMRVVSDGEHRQAMEVYPNVAILLQVEYVHPMIVWADNNRMYTSTGLNNSLDKLSRW